jgi:hypothetical protein
MPISPDLEKEIEAAVDKPAFATTKNETLN